VIGWETGNSQQLPQTTRSGSLRLSLHTALAREEIERSIASTAIVSQLTINLFEADMAKRRNLKKEKAERNLAYARKFRKRTNTGRNMRSRMRPSNGGTSAEEDDTSSAAEG
jgi:hypothetical protein